MQMARKKKMVTLTLSPEIVERLEKWLGSQELPPAKNAVMEVALDEFLAKRSADQKHGEGK